MFRRRRPVLGAAVVGGAAYAAGKHRERTQQEEEALYEEPAEGGMTDEVLRQLEKLGKLHEQGILTDEEFTEQKQKLLEG